MVTETSDAVALNPYDYAFHQDPYPTYERLRNETPLYHNPAMNFWELTRHADVLAGFRDNVRLSNRNGVSLDPGAFGPDAHQAMSFLAMDHPRHLRLRTLVSRVFTPRPNSRAGAARGAAEPPPLRCCAAAARVRRRGRIRRQASNGRHL